MAEAEKNEVVTLTKGELKKLLDETATDAARKVSADMLASMVNRGDNPGANQIKDLADQIALSIAELSDQGTNRKRVAPEILAGRAKAYDKLITQLSEARDRADAARAEGNDAEAARWLPEYRVVAKTYLTDRIIEPWRRGGNNDLIPTEIIWRGIPNNSLRPLNAIAEKLFSTFQAWVGTEGLLRAESSFMTPGGVVIKGEAPVGSRLNPADDLRPSDLEISGTADPTATHIRVLGTIAEPARQNVAKRPTIRERTAAELARPTGQALGV
jgi:hypothetical protein